MSRRRGVGPTDNHRQAQVTDNSCLKAFGMSSAAWVPCGTSWSQMPTQSDDEDDKDDDEDDDDERKEGTEGLARRTTTHNHS